jgi:hypothetical protein
METGVVSETSVFHVENLAWAMCHNELLNHTARQCQTLHMTFELSYIRLSAVFGVPVVTSQVQVTAPESDGYAGTLNGFLGDLAVIVSDHRQLVSKHEERY